jgi:hypothetical protein
LILGQYDPPLFPHGRQPFIVLGTCGKVIVMDFNESTGLTKDIRNDMFAKIPI